MKILFASLIALIFSVTIFGCAGDGDRQADSASISQANSANDKPVSGSARAGLPVQATAAAEISPGHSLFHHAIKEDAEIPEAKLTGHVQAHPQNESTHDFARELKEDQKRLSQEAAANQKALEQAIYRVANPGPFKLVELGLNPQDRGKKEAEYWVARGETGDFGGTLTVSTFGDGPKTFNYWAHQDAESAGIGLLMFERLVEMDAWTGKIQPRLAKSIKISPDHLEYTIELRKGLRWSDGKPITADDVFFTFDTLIRKGYGSSSTRDTLTVYGKYPEITKVDDLTVKFRTARPFAPFLNCLANAPVAPKHAVEPITERPMEEFHGFWDVNCDPKSMVVSGPFKLNRYLAGQRVELVRNPYYAMVDKLGRRLPYLDRFVIAIVPDQNTQILKFYGNELDFLDIKTVRGFDAALMKQRESSGNFKMYNLGPDDGTVFLMFNMNRRKNPRTNKFYVDPIKQKWFNDPHFRQAVSHAINRKRLVDNILRGVGLSLYTAESPASLYFNKALKPYGQDLKYSEELLMRGGFKKRDGRLYDRDGNRVEFTLNTNAGNTARDATCIMLVNDLKELGMKVNYQPVEFNILIDKTATSLEWEAMVMGLTGDKIEPYNGANVWKSDGRVHMFDQRLPDKAGRTVVTDARDWEKEIDSTLDLAATTFDDRERHKHFDRYQEIVYEQQPFIYLYCILDISSARNKVGNYRPTPIGITYNPKGSFHNLEEIYVSSRKH